MEEELLALFESIDRNHDGSLTRDEIQNAFRQTGLTVSNRKLDEFIAAIDVNHDGVVSFEEWRCVQWSFTCISFGTPCSHFRTIGTPSLGNRHDLLSLQTLVVKRTKAPLATSTRPDLYFWDR